MKITKMKMKKAANELVHRLEQPLFLLL